MRATCACLKPACPDHPGYHVDSRGWCWFGGHYPNKERRMEAVKESPSSEAVETPGATVSFGMADGTHTEPILWDEFIGRADAPATPDLDNPRPDYRVIDNNTGEMVQLSLLGAQWEAYKVESLRWSLSGGDECIRTIFDELVTGGELSPGAIVEVTARGVVKEHAPIFKKGSHEGKTVISLEVLHRVHVLGHMTGSIEAGQNVDGEAKVLEEAPAEPQTCMNCAHGDEGVDDPGSPCAECASERDRWEPKVEGGADGNNADD